MSEAIHDGDQALLQELSEPVEKLVHRHLENAKEWYPYETTPWSLARNFTNADPWSPDEYPLSEGVRSALYVHLLTEDNLPYYTHTILGHSDSDHPLNEWTRRWTAEEGRHSMAIRDWILATRAFDPHTLEQGRMAQMSGGKVPEPESLADMLTYTSFQELATRVAHSNTGRKLDDEHGGKKVMALVAGDEGLHYQFYRDAAGAALEIDPSAMVLSITKQLVNFKMPGTGIPGFARHALHIAKEGIYDVGAFHDKVVKPTLEHWDRGSEFWDREDITDEAKLSRDELHTWLEGLAVQVRRHKARQERTRSRSKVSS